MVLVQLPAFEVTEVTTTPETWPGPSCGITASIGALGPTNQLGASASACADAKRRSTAACWSATKRSVHSARGITTSKPCAAQSAGSRASTPLKPTAPGGNTRTAAGVEARVV